MTAEWSSKATTGDVKTQAKNIPGGRNQNRVASRGSRKILSAGTINLGNEKKPSSRASGNSGKDRWGGARIPAHPASKGNGAGSYTHGETKRNQEECRRIREKGWAKPKQAEKKCFVFSWGGGGVTLGSDGEKMFQ